MKHLIALFLIIGFFFTFHNTSDETMICRLIWIDHNFDSPHPAYMMVAEIKPGKKFSNSARYDPGIWAAEWNGMGESNFKQVEVIKINPEIVRVFSEPGKECVQNEGI